MKCRSLFLVAVLAFLQSCQNSSDRLDELNALKKSFLQSMFDAEFEEGPFHLAYNLRTVFFSKDIVSMFGQFNEYTNLPHGWALYEGMTFCKVKGRFEKMTLAELFATDEQKEFLRSYCERDLINQGASYFSGKEPLRTSIDQKDISTFVIDDHFLIIIFQPYCVGGYADGPFFVKIPYEHLTDYWNVENRFSFTLNQVIESKAFIATWNEDESSF